MSFKPCSNCGVVIEEDLAYIQAYKLHKGQFDKDGYGVRVIGFKCPVCKFVTITNREDIIFFTKEELKEQLGDNIK